MNGIARANHQGQRRHDAGEDIDRHSQEPENSHGPDSTNKRRHAGNHSRPEASRYSRRKQNGHREPQRVENEHVATQCLRCLITQGRKAGELEVQASRASARSGQHPLNLPQHGIEVGGGIGLGSQAHHQQRRGCVGREQVPGNEGVVGGAVFGGGEGLLIQTVGSVRNDREKAAGHPLATDIKK